MNSPIEAKMSCDNLDSIGGLIFCSFVLILAQASNLNNMVHSHPRRCPDQLVQLQYKPAVPWLLSGYGFIPSRVNDVPLPSEVHHNPWLARMARTVMQL